MSDEQSRETVVTSKGQVVIPKKFRIAYGIAQGTRIRFVASKEGLCIQKVVPQGNKSKLLGRLKERLQGKTILEHMEGLRGPIDLPSLSK